jgi:hypothetical protein
MSDIVGNDMKHARNKLGASMKDYKVDVRIDAETNEHLVEMARRLNIPKGAVARLCIQEGLSRYDRQLDVVLHHVEKLTELLCRTHTMAAAAVAAAALPPNVGRKLSEPVRKEFETRVDRCMYFGSAIKSAHDRGIFSVDDGNVAAD